MLERPCLWLCDGHVPCGLLHGHAGAHVPFVPGDYLPPPILHPLDALYAWATWRCPLCNARPAYAPAAEVLTAFRGDYENWDRPSLEWQWYWSCGHMVRQFEAPAWIAGA